MDNNTINTIINDVESNGNALYETENVRMKFEAYDDSLEVTIAHLFQGEVMECQSLEYACDCRASYMDAIMTACDLV